MMVTSVTDHKVDARSTLQIDVNGAAKSVQIEPRTHLADYLRDHLGLTGTHLGCEHGVCGACTVMIDGAPARACITFAAACDGARVRTVEGFGNDPLMAQLRTAFSAQHALQCGYCTPGMLITAYDIVRRLLSADDRRIREELGGNLCRCTGYQGIVMAIRSVLAERAEDGAPAPVLLEPMPLQQPLATNAKLGALPRAGDSSGAATAPAAAFDPAVGSVRKVNLPVEPDALWRTLKDLESVVRCMPGASLPGPAPALTESGGVSDARIEFALAVAIGPMRARFEGSAAVHYDDRNLRGSIEGSGTDEASRTTGEGRVEFTVLPEAGGSALELSIDYQLRGGLAQFSRGAVVDAVTDQLIASFGQNVARLASGGSVEEQSEIDGAGLAAAAFWQKLKRFFY